MEHNTDPKNNLSPKQKKRKNPFFPIRFQTLTKHYQDQPYTYIVALYVVFLVEAAFFIFTLKGYLEGSNQDLVYIIFYTLAMVLCGSMATVFLILNHRKTPNRGKVFLTLGYIYMIFYMVYGTTLSYFDYTANDDALLLYFLIMTILVCFNLVDPFSYSLGFASTLILLLCLCHQSDPLSLKIIGYSFTFFILGIFVAFQSYLSICHKEDAEKKLEEMTIMDALTGIYNRRKLAQDLMKEGQSEKAHLYIMADINHFKNLNDTKGHAYGDEVLRTCASKLEIEFPHLVYRYGGDEFTVIIIDPDKEVVRAKLFKINKELDELYPDHSVELSFGYVYSIPKKEKRMEDALIKADHALYVAKEKCGHIAEYNPEMDASFSADCSKPK